MVHSRKQTCNGLFCDRRRIVFVVAVSIVALSHGVGANLYLKERGGAVVTKRRNWKNHSIFLSPNGRKIRSDMKSSVSSSQQSTSCTTKSFKDASSFIQVENNTDAASRTTSKSQVQNDGLSSTAIVNMSLLALQFGLQPILVKKFTPQTIVRSSVVFVQEVVKFIMAGAIYFSGTSKTAREADFEEWSIKTWFAIAGLPAFLYTVQNIFTLMAQQNIEALTFNVLNQTKILSAALSCYLILGKQQSKMQMLSLCLLVFSTLVIERIINPASLFLLDGRERAFALGNTLKDVCGAFLSLRSGNRRVTHGVAPLLVASMISGTAGALTQLSTQGGARRAWGGDESTQPVSRPPRNAYLFSMELSVASIVLLLFSLGCSSNGRSVLQSRSFFDNWTLHTFIPVMTNSIGGILVGLVTKHAGSVRKGFALIFGLLLSGIFQASGTGVRPEQIIGGVLAAVSLWMHTVHPYKE